MISYYNSRITYYQNKVTTTNATITSLENSHESLRVFKGVVQTSSDNFSNVSAKKESVVASLSGIQAHCDCAKEYASGMQMILSSIGYSVVSLNYFNLLLSIQAKLTWYWVEIEYYEAKVVYYKAQILYYEGLLSAAQAVANVVDEVF